MDTFFRVIWRNVQGWHWDGEQSIPWYGNKWGFELHGEPKSGKWPDWYYGYVSLSKNIFINAYKISRLIPCNWKIYVWVYYRRIRIW